MFKVFIFFVVHRAVSLSVTSCHTCTTEDSLLKFETIEEVKELSDKHTFLMQACIPDDLGTVHSISYKLTYRVYPPLPAAGTLFTWIEALDGQLEKLALVEAKNASDVNMRVAGTECIEVRYFGRIQTDVYHYRVYIKYSLDLWWFGTVTNA